MDRSLIEPYLAGAATLRKSVEGLTSEQLDWTPPTDAAVGRWSTRQVVVHLADAEAAFTDRMKRLIATENPTLLAWDENAFGANLFYNKQSAEDAVALIDLTRRQMARVLTELPNSALDRSGTHTERGRQTLKDVLTMAAWHLSHHQQFITQKRQLLIK